MRQEAEEYYMKCFQEHGGKFPTYEHRESDAAPYLRKLFGLWYKGLKRTLLVG